MSDEIEEIGVAFEEDEEVGLKKMKLGMERHEVGGHKRKRATRVAEKDVEEEELEEFFLILRRMQESLNYFKNAKGRDGNKELSESRGPWRAVLEKEILAGRLQSRPREEAGIAEENSGLDLNKDPQPLEDNP